MTMHAAVARRPLPGLFATCDSSGSYQPASNASMRLRSPLGPRHGQEAQAARRTWKAGMTVLGEL
jgi:hypothetical protein